MKTTYLRRKLSRVNLTASLLVASLAGPLTGCKTEPAPDCCTKPTASAPAAASSANSSTAGELKSTPQITPSFPKEMTLFDGKTLTGWQITDFGGHGEVEVENGELRLYMGAELSGINWTNGPLPKSNYEVSLDTMKLEGSDFFCGLTVPVHESHCSLILGGWGGGIVGISSLDGMDASENDTSKSMYFERNRWFHIRLRVLDEKILVWIDDQKVIDVNIKDRKVALRPGDIERSVPLGISAWQTSSALKNIILRQVSGEQ